MSGYSSSARHESRRVPGGAGLVDPPRRRPLRRAFESVVAVGRGPVERPREGIERVAGLGLGGFGHQRLVDDLRPLRRRWMHPVVEHPAGDVGGVPVAGARDELVVERAERGSRIDLLAR